MIEHVVIDLDGTLVDSCGICVEILTDMILERDVCHKIDYSVARPLMSHGGVRMVSTLLGPAAEDPVSDLAEFRSRYRDLVTPPQALFPGVISGLERMKRAGLRLSICSNKPQDLCEAVLLQTGIWHFFEVVVGGAPGRNPKPALDMLVLLEQKIGASGHNSVFVGDSDIDHKAALAANMRFMFVTYGYAESGWQPTGSECFSSFSDLASTLAVHNYADADG